MQAKLELTALVFDWISHLRYKIDESQRNFSMDGGFGDYSRVLKMMTWDERTGLRDGM